MAVFPRASAECSPTNATTTFTIVIPASVQAGDDLYVSVNSKGHTSGTTFVTCLDNDTGGNTWTKVANSTNRVATVFHKKATSGSASKTITVAGGVSSTCGGLVSFRGGWSSGDPTNDVTIETNIAGANVHAGFTPTYADSMICLLTFNTNLDHQFFDQSSANMRIMDEGFDVTSDGGGRCGAAFAYRRQLNGPSATGNFTWSVENDTTISIVFSIRPEPVVGQTKFRFTLAADRVTSAKIYNSSTNVLVRNLWDNYFIPAGTYDDYWDGNDESGAPYTSPTTIKVTSNDVQVNWGVVGNTSTNQSDNTTFTWLEGMCDCVFVGDKAWYGTRFCERSPYFGTFDKNTPQQKLEDVLLFQGYGYVGPCITHLATDGTNIYVGVHDAFNSASSFLFAIKASDNTEVNFSSGTPTSVQFGRSFDWSLNPKTGGEAQYPTGLAVGGTYIYECIGGSNQLVLINKSTGAVAATNTSFINPRGVAVNGTKLWLIHGTNTIERFSLSGTSVTSDSVFITGTSNPQKLSISSNGSIVVVVDGGTSQQIKGYNNSNGSSAWTLGQAGGHQTVSTAAHDRFHLTEANTLIPSPWATFDGDGDLWVGDPGNYRVAHFDTSRTFVEEIMAMGTFYQCSTDINDPTRVFMQHLELSVQSDGSWTRAANWAGGLDAGSWATLRRMFVGCATLSNGRTYAFVEKQNYPYIYEIVELVAGGTTRMTGINNIADVNIHLVAPRFLSNGTIIWVYADPFNPVGDPTAQVRQRALTGFDGSNNPTFAAYTSVTYPNYLKDIDAGFEAVHLANITTSNKFFVYSGSNHHDGYHLAAFNMGDSTYQWQTEPTVRNGFYSNFPPRAEFYIDDSVNTAGGDIVTIGNYCFLNQVSEGYKGQTQTNIWNMFDDNGQMITQFGKTGVQASRLSSYPYTYAQMAGNAFSAAGAIEGSNYVIYHCDESYHSGVHRWVISNLNTISTQTASIVSTGGMAGTTSLSISQTGAVTGKGTLSGTGIQFSISQVGNLRGSGALASSGTQFSISQTGNLRAAGTLVAAVTCSISQSGSLIGKGALTGTTTLDITSTGAMNEPSTTFIAKINGTIIGNISKFDGTIMINIRKIDGQLL